MADPKTEALQRDFLTNTEFDALVWLRRLNEPNMYRDRIGPFVEWLEPQLAALAATSAPAADANPFGSTRPDPISDAEQAALYKHCEGSPYYSVVRRLYRVASSATSAPSEPATLPLPHPGLPEVSAALDAVLAEYNYPANPKNAARAGWTAATRWLNTHQPMPAVPVASDAVDLVTRLTGLPTRPEQIALVLDFVARSAPSAAPSAAPAVRIFDDRPQLERLAKAEHAMRNPPKLVFEDERAQPELNTNDMFGQMPRVPQPEAPAEPSVSVKPWTNNKMNPWVCTLTPHQARRVGKTGEEVGELGAVLGRLNIQGLHEIDPSSGKTNFQRLWEKHYVDEPTPPAEVVVPVELSDDERRELLGVLKHLRSEAVRYLPNYNEHSAIQDADAAIEKFDRSQEKAS